ncbi:golgin candidate 4-like [Ananas comosus]|uniref:Golgin candidate 4 n=1 Tax=Ananas comosus TaxID=4615 RepID=A0A199VZK2_ANACO|nr:golgin candidate 4-like [Ananas comosus]OAY82454.1 Golgin candidate 4 [Ananas comosus]
MRSSISNYRESLSRIASEVLDGEDELEIPESRGEVSPVSARRFPRRSSRATPPHGSPVGNGADSEAHGEIAKYKEEIQKLQASEAEIKALSFNYAAMLKEKEEQLSKLHEENESLRRSLETKVTSEQSLAKVQRHATGDNSRFGSHAGNVNIPKKDGYSNGSAQAVALNGMHKPASSLGIEKEYLDVLEEKNRSLAGRQANLESQIKQLRSQLENEQEKATILKQKLEDEYQHNSSFERELQEIKADKEKASTEMKELRKELNEKVSELRRVQEELNRRGSEEVSDESLQHLRSVILNLQKENAQLKLEKGELEANLKLMTSTAGKKGDEAFDTQNEEPDWHKVKEEMSLTIHTLEEALKETRKERDKTLHQLDRLKQHLLDKEQEDSEKMDEDTKMIEELRANCEYQKNHILQLERALKQEIAKREDIKKLTNDELQKSNEIIHDLKQKLTSCMSALESKNIELVNLQTALGQYYAESEAKERLGRDLASAREELSKVSESLKVANQQLELSIKEKEEIAAKLSQSERILAEGRHSMQKLEEDNSRLRRALEQSMTTLNRMSLDSDNYVDRRIVIKLLVTYFQRNHSKEVLDLMVRMLGFSEEDKQRIGFAQHAAGKGVVRGVLGLPGRLVGGILGGHSQETSTKMPSENQSFADLWVDFLLKETEERERRESAEASRVSSNTQEKSTTSPSTSNASNLPPVYPSTNQTFSSSKQSQLLQHPDTEFATVPLTSSTDQSERNLLSRPPPRYSY